MFHAGQRPIGIISISAWAPNVKEGNSLHEGQEVCGTIIGVINGVESIDLDILNAFIALEQKFSDRGIHELTSIIAVPSRKEEFQICAQYKGIARLSYSRGGAGYSGGGCYATYPEFTGFAQKIEAVSASI